MPSTITPMTPRLRGLLTALAGTTVWATTGILIRLLLTRYSIQPLSLAFWRDLMVAAALLLILGVGRRDLLRLKRGDLPFLLAYGGLALALFNGLWVYSVQFNGAAVATVLAYSSPAFTVLLARPLLREPLTPRRLGAVAVSFLGCLLVSRAHTPQAWQLNPLGILVGLGTGLAFAFYSLAGRWSARRFGSPWTVTAYGFLFAALSLGLTQNGGTLFTLGPAWDGWLILAGLALGPSLLGFGLYTLSLRDLPASLASLIAALEPALTALIAVLFLHERLDGAQWLGGGLILAAVMLAQGE